MSALRLRIDKLLEGDLPRPPQVYARIYSLGGTRRPPRQELVPISHAEGDSRTVELEPGRYYVEVVLPSGEILADDVEVSDGETSDLIFRPEFSPREWLSWQHLVGNVQSRRPAELPEERGPLSGMHLPGTVDERSGDSELDRSDEPDTAIRRRARSASPGGRRRRRVRPPTGSAAERPLEVDMARPIRCLSLPHSVLGRDGGERVWSWLAHLAGANLTTLLHTLHRDEDSFEVTADVYDSERAVFRLNGRRAAGGPGRRQRCFAGVQRRRSVELISLPVPWAVIGAGREADIEVVIQQPAGEGEFCSAASALDEFGMVLGYLSSGSLPTVRQMAETAGEMLYSKFENPFAAAAGCYALVGTAREAKEQEWHAWVRNLMDRFPHIPDGAVQWGQLRLRMRRDASDIEDAKATFKLAYRRGLPFYSTGVRWLLDGLEWASRDDEEAAEMLRNVQRLALRTHYQQPFTILRLGGDAGV